MTAPHDFEPHGTEPLHEDRHELADNLDVEEDLELDAYEPDGTLEPDEDIVDVLNEDEDADFELELFGDQPEETDEDLEVDLEGPQLSRFSAEGPEVDEDEDDEEELVAVPLSAAEELRSEDEGGEPEEPGELEDDLETILLARLGMAEDDEEDAEGVEVAEMVGDVEEPASFTPRGADEFLCLGCFLVKSKSQLSDAESSRCADCVADGVVAQRPHHRAG